MTVPSLARPYGSGRNAPSLVAGMALVLQMVFVAGCSDPRPVPLTLGETACNHCHMTLMDERFAAELLTITGKAYTFDSVECLASFALESTDEIHSLWVTNFGAPSHLVRVEEAFFVRSPLLKSPMGMGLVAFGEGMTPEDALNSFAGELLDWQGVLDVVRGEGSVAPGADGQRVFHRGGHLGSRADDHSALPAGR